MRIYNSLTYFKDDNYILSIALKNGFNSLEYFSEVFKKNMGVSPNVYKKYSNYKNITDKEEEKILNNLSRIINIKTNVSNYLNHRKPIISNYVKKFELKSLANLIPTVFSRYGITQVLQLLSKKSSFILLFIKGYADFFI